MSYATGQDISALALALRGYLASLTVAGRTQPARLVDVYNWLEPCGEAMSTSGQTITRELFRHLRELIHGLRHGHRTCSTTIADIVEDVSRYSTRLDSRVADALLFPFGRRQARLVCWNGSGVSHYSLASDRTIRRYALDPVAFRRQWAN